MPFLPISSKPCVIMLHLYLVLLWACLQVKMSGAGHQATLVFKQSMTYFEPLYERLKRRHLDDELKVGLSCST